MDAFTQAASMLPPAFRRRAEALPEQIRRQAEELRLRAGRVPAVTLGKREVPFPGGEWMTGEDLQRTIEIATRASTQAAFEKLRQGWFTVPGGHRVGLCGEVTTTGGESFTFRKLSSLNIRVARQVSGCALEIFETLRARGFPSVLILAPPGAGKTTLLRDLIRLLSEEAGPIGLCDERGEVAALREGIPQFDVGSRTDILDGCPKAEGLMILLRGMGARFLACDEITDPADAAALAVCAGCGVRLLATAHGVSLKDLDRRPVYQTLQPLFGAAVLIQNMDGRRNYCVEDLIC